MAQDIDFKKFVDVDNTVINPSPQRIRNILTLEEKIAVIQAYDQRPMYKKVARMFNCSWEQIKNIIINRDAIWEFYTSTTNKNKIEVKSEDDTESDLKQRKIKFLGECVYECIQRLQYHAKIPISEEVIRHKALEFLDVLRIPGFSPTKKWLNIFKATYNITLSNKQISISTEPPFSLDIKDIMTYCTKARTSKCLLRNYKKHDVRNVEYEAKRLRKLNFLQEALKEYLLRIKFHHKSMKLDTISLQKVARDFNEILKVQDFEPTTEWIDCFRKKHNSEECLANAKRPPLSLDLKDILSYCSRMQNKAKDNTVTLAPKETVLQMRVLPKYPGQKFTDAKSQKNCNIYLYEEDFEPTTEWIDYFKKQYDSEESLANAKKPPLNSDSKDVLSNCSRKVLPKYPGNNIPKTKLKFQQNSIIYLDEEAVSKDIKPDIEELHLAKDRFDQPPPLKIRKIESINQDPELQRTIPDKAGICKTPLIIRQIRREQSQEQAKQPTNLADNFPKNNTSCYTSQSASVKIKEETIDDSSYILPTNPPQLRIQHTQKLASPTSFSPVRNNTTPHPTTHSPENHDNEDLPRHVSSFKDVLLLLKPLEEYAMLKENYRAIGLITMLEEVLKNGPEIDTGDEEFIG